jgi:hypothetical protein
MPETGPGVQLDRAALAALLETLLPGSEHWPGASELDLAATVTERVLMASGHDEAIERLLERLGAGFEEAAPEKREAAVRAEEGTDEFAAALLVAYDAYYVNPRVLELLEERCGYVQRPPQPEGFRLDPFDESRLETVRKRKPFWRQA